MHITELNSHLLVTSGDTLLLPAANQAIKIPPPDVPPNLSKGQLQVLNKEDRTITSITTSRDGKHIAVSTENKQIVVFDTSFHILQNFIVNRAPSKILFTKSGDMLVADRTGDVYLYKNATSEPILLLGHLSMILDMELSECEKYIITCDRDEKIRVSRFPNTYNIVSFCLGHGEFVIRIKVVKGVLVSASGDGTVRVWDYVKGVQLSAVDANVYVEDKKLLEEFSGVMDKEKVDVLALPITDMQVVCDGGCLVVAVSLHSCKAIQLYTVDLGSYKWSVLNSVEVEALHKFYLSSSLYIFDSFKMSVYNLDGSVIATKMDDFYEQYKDFLKINEDGITVLYKRKFDNVQEYLERKKLRLQSGK